MSGPTRGQVVRMAREAGFNPEGGGVFKFDDFDIERFAEMAYAAGQAAERENILRQVPGNWGEAFDAFKAGSALPNDAPALKYAFAAGMEFQRNACASLADGWAAVRKPKSGGLALRNFAAALRGDEGACTSNKPMDEMLAEAYAKGMEEGADAEREACEREADYYAKNSRTALLIYEAIRARGQK